MDGLINAIGGYGSWQFAVLSLVCWIVGGVLYTKWVYFIPLPIFGSLLVLSFIINEVQNALDKGINGVVIILPLFWILFSIIALIKFYPKKKRQKIKTVQISDNCKTIDERDCAICSDSTKCKKMLSINKSNTKRGVTNG